MSYLGKKNNAKLLKKMNKKFGNLRKKLREAMCNPLTQLDKVNEIIKSTVKNEIDQTRVTRIFQKVSQLAKTPRTVIGFLLDRLPIKSAISRERNRCTICGNPRGVIRAQEQGICRHHMRSLFNHVLVPGVIKASW